MPPEIQELISLLLQTVITVAVPILVVEIRNWLLARREEALARVPQDQLYLIESVVRILVQAAEQSGTAGLIRNEGKAKKAWVILRAQEELERLGLPNVNAKLLADLVEAKVLETLNQPQAVIEIEGGTGAS